MLYIEMGKIINDKANEVFHRFMDIIPNTEIMSEVLDIKQTEDTDILLRAFTEKYWDLVFPFSKNEEREVAVKQLQESSIAVVGKYSKNGNKNK